MANDLYFRNAFNGQQFHSNSVDEMSDALIKRSNVYVSAFISLLCIA